LGELRGPKIINVPRGEAVIPGMGESERAGKKEPTLDYVSPFIQPHVTFLSSFIRHHRTKDIPRIHDL
jgi:hypothetical protein